MASLTIAQRQFLMALDTARSGASGSLLNQINSLQSAVFCNGTNCPDLDATLLADAGFIPPVPLSSALPPVPNFPNSRIPANKQPTPTVKATPVQQLEAPAPFVEKAPWVYISPLIKTELPGYSITPTPYDETDFGTGGTMYDPKLDATQGVIYLKRYLSSNEELSNETARGSEWRFQYAPADNKWAREGNYQQDNTWSTNQQPYHFKNVSGKVYDINAIMEGYSLNRSLDGQIRSLERMLSVNTSAPDQPQLTPYTFRLIIGGRTVSDPVNGIHIPFILTQLSIVENTYDLRGRVMQCTVNLTLREVPSYQVNFGRKLNLVAAATTPITNSNKCPAFKAEYVKLLALLRETNIYYQGLHDGAFKGGTDYNPANTTDKEKDTLKMMCTAQNQNFLAIKKLEEMLMAECKTLPGVTYGEAEQAYNDPYVTNGKLFYDFIKQYGTIASSRDIPGFPNECLPLNNSNFGITIRDPATGALIPVGPNTRSNNSISQDIINCYFNSKERLLMWNRTETTTTVSNGCVGCGNLVNTFKGNFDAFLNGGSARFQNCVNNIVNYWQSYYDAIDKANSTNEQKQYSHYVLGQSMKAEVRDFQNFLTINTKQVYPTEVRIWTSYGSCNANQNTFGICNQYVAINEVITSLNKLIGSSPASAPKPTTTTTPTAQ